MHVANITLSHFMQTDSEYFCRDASCTSCRAVVLDVCCFIMFHFINLLSRTPRGCGQAKRRVDKNDNHSMECSAIYTGDTSGISQRTITLCGVLDTLVKAF